MCWLRISNSNGFLIDKNNLTKNTSKKFPLTQKYLKKLTGSFDNHFAKWLMNEIEKGNSIFLEITPRYFSTWRIPVPEE